MGQAASADKPADCDLDDEAVEEIRMITALPLKEIYRLRRKFLELADAGSMSRAQFFAIPGVAQCPLRDRLFQGLELTADASISFQEFARFAHVFSFHSSPAAKLREAFRLHDFDGDGKISAGDLRTYLALVYQLPPDDSHPDPADAEVARLEMIELLAARVLDEASSAPTKDFLAFDDFAKVVQATDFESRLTIPI